MARAKNGNIVKSLSLRPKVIKKLEDEAYQRGITQSELVSRALTSLYKMEKAMAVRPVIREGAVDVDDVLEAVVYDRDA